MNVPFSDCDLVDFDMFQSLRGEITARREKGKKFLENYCWSIGAGATAHASSRDNLSL